MQGSWSGKSLEEKNQEKEQQIKFMKASDKYKLELNSYASFKDEESCDLCAWYFYGKFLTYVDDDDYVGATLAKRFLSVGKLECSQSGYNNNKFIPFFKQAETNNKFKELKDTFFYDGMGRQKRKVETEFSEAYQK